MTDGGDGSSGYKHTEDALKKMSATHAGKHHSPATEFKVGQPSPRLGKKGYKETEEHRRKIGDALKNDTEITRLRLGLKRCASPN